MLVTYPNTNLLHPTGLQNEMDSLKYVLRTGKRCRW